jgi:hypothetical protein
MSGRAIITPHFVSLREDTSTNCREFRLQKSCIWDREDNISGDVKSGLSKSPRGSKKRTKKGDDDFLILGFDTEFQTPHHAKTYQQIREGEGKYQVLSYQFFAHYKDGCEWKGICIPEENQRITLAEFIVFALAKGIEENLITKIPKMIYLVGHFTRADIPAFKDFGEFSDLIGNVRNTFLSIDRGIPLKIQFEDQTFSEHQILIRDTILLAPTGTKSLASIGEMVGTKKITLSEDPEKEKFYKENMIVLIRENWELFKEYALVDAEICVRYAMKVMDEYTKATGNRRIPVTLTSIGIEFLLKSWAETQGFDQNEALGKEHIIERVFDKKSGWFKNEGRDVFLQEVDWFIDFVTETYHGGRNEQFWFGPAFKDHWTDYDLSSAYPTAMNLIGFPKWRDVFVTHDIDKFLPTTLGFVCVDFKFPDHVRYPCLPVRTQNGLIFPLQGRSMCSAPELYVARKLGAEILNIRHGVIVPSNPDQRVFGSFIADCIRKRGEYPKKSIDALFWKELSNSTYGKTAQGLREKRVFNLKKRETEQLPPSKITNAYYASFITSFVRAILGEIMNSIPEDKMVFSCTTDGFLTNASMKDIEKASKGELCQIYRESRKQLTDVPSLLEIKHKIKKPLGWRTRGQATLIAGDVNPDDHDHHIVLAKGGIYSPEKWTSEKDNEYVVDLFFNRKPDHMIKMDIKTSMRDIVLQGSDFVSKSLEKRLSMEFDWKRCPLSVTESKQHKHVVFSTNPWRSFDEFQSIREIWDQFTNDGHRCVKTIEDYREFVRFANSRMGVDKSDTKYMKKRYGDIERLKMLLCCAYKQGEAGFPDRPEVSAKRFSQILTECGIPCKDHDPDYGKNREFKPNSCPRTEHTLEALGLLRKHFPTLEPDELLSNKEVFFLLPTGGSLDRFVRKAE